MNKSLGKNICILIFCNFQVLMAVFATLMMNWTLDPPIMSIQLPPLCLGQQVIGSVLIMDRSLSCIGWMNRWKEMVVGWIYVKLTRYITCIWNMYIFINLNIAQYIFSELLWFLTKINPIPCIKFFFTIHVYAIINCQCNQSIFFLMFIRLSRS